VSNVLIGIIGVILFIGLALAGALFLGERFAQSRNTSVAASTIQAVTQVTNGINLYNTENGSPMAAATDPNVLADPAARYLKSIPTNPTGGAGAVILSDTATSVNTLPGRLVVMKLAGATADVCKAIARQTTSGLDTVGQNGFVEANDATEMPRGPAGCFLVKTAFGALDANGYYAFARP
jgi:hypothetical protein